MDELRFIELRADVDNRVLEGTVVRYGDKARIAGLFDEILEPDSLRWEDVILNLQHDRAKPLARTEAGMQLTARDGVVSLRAEVAPTTYGNDALALVRSGVLRGFSVEMKVTEDRWSAGGTLRNIRKASLKGIGLVDKPAYPDSTISLRAKHLIRRPALWL